MSRVDVFNFVLGMDRAFREESQLHKKPSYSKPKGVSFTKSYTPVHAVQMLMRK